MEWTLVVIIMVETILLGLCIVIIWKKNGAEGINELEDLMKEGIYRLERNQNSSSNEMESRIFQTFSEVSKLQQNQIHQMSLRNDDSIFKVMENVDTKMEMMRTLMERRMEEFRSSNEMQLEKIRLTVDEKLHKTLEERLGESFKIVSERLELVHKGLGEMNVLVEGVGDLKKVLSNVKLRGVMGEVQLEQILSQVLSPEQYVKNVKLNPNTQDMVEFAIKFPGRGRSEEVYLPVDAKFPVEAYFRLTQAYEQQDMELFEKSRREMEAAFRKNAKDISSKYLYPPVTTDFAIMFLPIEGLYAELIRQGDLLEKIQREYKVIVAGPTNFVALLSSLQLGFRTLAIEKHTSQVWELLSTVKTEFHKFGVVLEKTQRKLNDAGNELDQLIGVRSRKLIRELDKITQLEGITDSTEEE